jgi:HAD superfamily hydrolase (TIGR01509 family)
MYDVVMERIDHLRIRYSHWLMVRAVVFDFDGLILDTETPVFTAWQDAFTACGCAPLTLEEWAAQIGTVGGFDLDSLLRARATMAVDFVALHEQRRARRDELLAVECARPGIVEWLDAADARGLPVAIASSSPPDWVEGHLERITLRDRFAYLACHTLGIAAKPAPDLYLAACHALGVAPEDAVALEDSPNGVTAAKRAGLFCVAVPNAVTARLDLSKADLVVPSLAACSFDDVVRRAERR